jgi:hypothetical protein
MYIFHAIFDLSLGDVNMALKITELTTFDGFDYLDDY